MVYHAWTFGWIIGEIIHRVDGRSIAQFAREALCQPLGIADFYLGIPDALEPRVAPLRQDARHLALASQLSELDRRVAPPQVTSAEVVNRPDVRRASIPAGGGIMSAHAIARHYAMLAGYGELDGIRILSAERIDIIRALQTYATDDPSKTTPRVGLGYMLAGAPEQGGVLAMGHQVVHLGIPAMAVH